MTISKVLSKYQITLPKEVVHQLHISKGDLLKCEARDGRISLTPVIVEEPYSEEELKTFEMLYADPKNAGKIYRKKSEALAHLKRLR